MKRFDPKELMIMLEGDTGYRFDLDDSFSEAEAVGGLASTAHADTIIVIDCYLVGYNEPATKLLKKAHQWLMVAIEKEEHPNYYAVDGTEAIRYYDMSLINWLITGCHDDDSLQKYVEHQDRYLQGDIKNDKVSISLILPEYLDAGQYQRALEIFEQTPGLRIPTQLKRIRNEAGMVYVLCRHKLGLEYTIEQVKDALKGFLDKNINNWLVNGHSSRAAKWMKISYWNENPDKLKPKDAILKCYDHLPGVDPPENINNNK